MLYFWYLYNCGGDSCVYFMLVFVFEKEPEEKVAGILFPELEMSGTQ